MGQIGEGGGGWSLWSRMYTAKYVQYVTHIAPVYRLFTKLIRPLSEPLIATKLRVQFFPFNGFTAIPPPFSFLFLSFFHWSTRTAPDNSKNTETKDAQLHCR